MILRISIIGSFFLFLSSCGSDLNEIDYLVNEEQLAYEEAHDINMIYSDSAIVRVNIAGPRMLRILDRENPRQEFPDGVKVIFYSANNQATSTLTAKYAVRYDKKNEIIIRDSVIWQSHKGERLETEELIWEEQKERVYSHRFVKIVKPDEVIYGYGFEANQDFTEWTINAVEAKFLQPLTTEE
ncbi:MAG: LPS export ABC transporter protein LptC [Saprospiraceae bacterium]|jgi:LPS export ABC transporter protein LptC